MIDYTKAAFAVQLKCFVCLGPQNFREHRIRAICRDGDAYKIETPKLQIHSPR